MSEEIKRKFALWIYPKVLSDIEEVYKEDNCQSISEFIEKAVKFYIGYLKRDGNIDYIAPILLSAIDAAVTSAEDRQARLTFKVAVELAKLSNILAAMNDIDDDTMRKLHLRCVNEVRKINGIISMEKAMRYQFGSDLY